MDITREVRIEAHLERDAEQAHPIFFDLWILLAVNPNGMHINFVQLADRLTAHIIDEDISIGPNDDTRTAFLSTRQIVTNWLFRYVMAITAANAAMPTIYYHPAGERFSGDLEHAAVWQPAEYQAAPCQMFGCGSWATWNEHLIFKINGVWSPTMGHATYCDQHATELRQRGPAH